jgi:hypothetical protein
VPGTIQALLVLVLASLPGALYTWAFEQQAGPWGVGLADRVLRFVGASAVFHALLAPATYGLWRNYVEPGTVEHGRPLPWWLWLIPIGYVAVPLVAGRLVGLGAANRQPWARFITGRAPAPTAWDHVFSTAGLEAWVRIKLTDGTWIGGAYAQGPASLRSYAAGYPEHRDIYLAWTAVVDATTGEFEPGADGRIQLQPAGALIRAERIDYCLIEEAAPES